MRFYNTLSRRLENFTPLEPGLARLYTCGPTVYDYAHIGNFRAYLFEDVLRRALRFEGYRVKQVMNLTDVDDKTIRGAREAGLPLKAYTQTYVDAFFEDLATLAVEPAEVYPAATEHVPDMIRLIERLLERGHAYQSPDGSIYYSIASFPDYGKLSHLNLDGMRAGARVVQDEYDKERVSDFALWKAWQEEDGDVAWDSPWGRGRPGWHIECSAMSMRYLGETFDLHTGGVDNMFPHHENEIAQSEGATGKPFVKTWLHNAHLRVEGEKMSKSLGNFYTLRDLIEQGFSGREIRYVLMSAHYRQTLNFTLDSLRAARRALARLDAFRDRLGSLASGASEKPAGLPAWAAEGRRSFAAALADDLNMSEALSALFDLVHGGNRAMDAGALAAAQAAGVLGLLKELDRVLGVLQQDAAQAPEEVEELVRRRDAARAQRDWAAADRLRDELRGLGWEVQDTPTGAQVKRAPA